MCLKDIGVHAQFLKNFLGSVVHMIIIGKKEESSL